MNNSQAIIKAIGAHGMWKQRLTEAINGGRSDATPEQVAADNLCEFGRWLYGLPPADHHSEHYKKVHLLHASFHREAAKVLRLALSGQKVAAEKCLGLGGSYTNASADLTTAMMNWKRTLVG